MGVPGTPGLTMLSGRTQSGDLCPETLVLIPQERRLQEKGKDKTVLGLLLKSFSTSKKRAVLSQP